LTQFSDATKRMGEPKIKAWFRMYAEFVSDAKVQLLAFEDQRHFVALLCLKCNGTLDSEAPSTAFRDRMVAKALGLQPDAAIEARRRLVEVGIITDDWQPVKWSDRQFESDSSAERTRAWRERKSQDRHRDDDVTSQRRPRSEQIQNRTETPAVAGLDLVAWNRWETYRREIRKPLKQASIPAAQRKLAAYGSNQSAAVENSIANGWTGLFAPKDAAKNGGGFVC
jgi:hypothetical protein